MPPKKRTSARKQAEPTNKAFLANDAFSKILDQVATAHDNNAGKAFEEFFRGVCALTEQHANEKWSADQLNEIICGDLEEVVVKMTTRQPVNTQSLPSTSTVKPKKERSTTSQQPDNSALVRGNSQDETNDSDSDMEVESTTETKEEPLTSPINAQMTDAEVEDVAIPRTLIRMAQMSISKKATVLTPQSAAYTNTPRRNPPRDAQNGGTPRNIFPTTPGRTAGTPGRMFGTPGRMGGTPGRVVVAPTAVHRVIPFQATDNDPNRKQKHADDLRQLAIDKKKENARQAEVKRKEVLERKAEIDKERVERLEALRKQEERAANFAKQHKEAKSPTRARIVPPVKAPVGKKNVARKVFESQSEQNPTTPGRGPAKKGRIEVASKQEGQKTTVTVAQPTVELSPSRDLPRNVNRLMKEEPMDFEETTPPVRQPKPKAKAKRSHAVAAPSTSTAVAADPQVPSPTLASQEHYLIQQAAESRARAEEQKRLAEKKAAEERAEAARRMQAEEEQARLLQVQKEEEERLRAQVAREEAELKATLAKQAEKKARLEALNKTPPPTQYVVTPPTKYTAKSKNDYGLHDLNSDDETDQEDDPRKEVPLWADFAVVRDNVRRHVENPPFDVSAFFGEIDKPDLKTIFGDGVKAKKRGSSAVWKSSPAMSSSTRTPLQDISE